MLTLICCRSLRVLNNFSHVVKSPFLVRKRPFSVTATVCYSSSHRWTPITSDAAHKRLRKKYDVPEGYKAIYQESKSYLIPMLCVRVALLFFYCIPIWVPAYVVYWQNHALIEFLAQDNLAAAAVIMGAYCVFFHYVTSTYVEALFYNPETKKYRIFLLKKFSIRNRYIDFTNDNLKLAKVKIPIINNQIFKLGNQHVVLYEHLFFHAEDHYELTHKAFERAK